MNGPGSILKILPPRAGAVEQKITVLALEGDHYVQHGQFAPGQQANSRLLDRLVIDVESVFQAAKG